MGGEQTPAVS